MFFVAIKMSSKTNKPYAVLYADLKYRQIALSFQWSEIAEILHTTVEELYNKPVGTVIKVGA